MTPEDVATSRAAAAEAEKARWEQNREDMMPEEREMVLTIEAFERRNRYQLRADPTSRRMEELLRTRPVHTANDLARAQEANAERMQAIQHSIQPVGNLPMGRRCNFDSYKTALRGVARFNIGPMD